MENLLDKFTTHLKNVLTKALVLAVERGEETVDPMHLLWALSSEPGSLSSEILGRQGLQADVIVESMDTVTKGPLDPSAVPNLTSSAKRIIEKAVLVASESSQRYVGTEHLLLAWLNDAPREAHGIIEKTGASVPTLRKHLQTALRVGGAFPDPEALETVLHQGEGALEENEDEDSRSALEFFAEELTRPEVVNGLTPVIGREPEIERLIYILNRRTKNNPLLIGEPGVGKTAIVEGLAKRIVEGKVPASLAEKRLYQLDLATLVAGTMYRGEFESRMRSLIDELDERPEVILFIDEVHMLMGAGSGSSANDAANMLKPALSRGQVRLIGATTPSEYKRSIETDGAMERRFEVVRIDEPTVEETRLILKGVAPAYESFHGVKYSEAALESAVALSARYFPGKHFPDKAIDLIDEAGAASYSDHFSLPPQQKTTHALRSELSQAIEQKREAVLKENFSEATRFKGEEDRLRSELSARHTSQQPHETVNVEAIDIVRAVTRLAGVTDKNLSLDERDNLNDLTTQLKARVYGQDETVMIVANAVQRAKLGLSHHERPLCSFLFVGPSGVGKTELAKSLSEKIAHKPDSFLRLNMSEYAEPHTVSKLLGSPAGYVGYRDHAALTDHLKLHPDAIVLFDELEKAHRDVQHLLLQILDQGEIMDSTGRLINCRQSMIIATTNAGSERFERGQFGFGEHNDSHLETDIKEQLRDVFSRELLNRFDRICLFRPLTKTTLETVATRELGELAQRAQAHQAQLQVSNALLLTLLADLDPKRGARAVREKIDAVLGHLLAEHLLSCRKAKHQLAVSANKNGSYKVNCK